MFAFAKYRIKKYTCLLVFYTSEAICVFTSKKQQNQLWTGILA